MAHYLSVNFRISIYFLLIASRLTVEWMKIETPLLRILKMSAAFSTELEARISVERKASAYSHNIT